MTQARGMYFEDFQVGSVLVSPARTITSADIVNFACLSGDFNEVHTNFEYCRSTQFGEPIAHGPLVYAVAGGLTYASGINDGTLLALLEITNWRMLAPVKHGDTIRVYATVTAVKPSSKPDRGAVTLQRSIRNQHGQDVQQMTATLLYRRRSQPDAGKKAE
jgi:acyl dehydratase